MIKIIKGNLLDATENLICHQVNCKGVMGSGVARVLRDKYPDIFPFYKLLCDSYGSKLLGQIQKVFIDDNKYIVNMFGEDTYGKIGLHTNYGQLEIALKQLYTYAKNKGYTVAMPYKIGCGLGGGDWDGVVYPMLETIFTDINLTLYKLGD